METRKITHLIYLKEKKGSNRKRSDSIVMFSFLPNL